nr:hypothetical protein [Psychrobacter sp. JCM 18900]
MRYTSNVGITHWDEPRHVDGIIQERSQQFFCTQSRTAMHERMGP